MIGVSPTTAAAMSAETVDNMRTLTTRREELYNTWLTVSVEGVEKNEAEMLGNRRM